ncbi:putative Nudix hydrolase NudL [Alphaproteobacteria bacterium SO-S41]|nr:putative Nudix hydrolase NudL [Alphaproteobacteria bacterium SO-S41]
MSLAEQNPPHFAIPEGDPRVWLRAHLRPLEDAAVMTGPKRGDFDLNPGERKAGAPAFLRNAAVLVPIIHRPAGLTVLLTRRSAHLSSHAGQVAFPGGRIDDTDDGPVDAALRETEEETGIPRDFVTPVGLLDPYETGSGFVIIPVVGVLREGCTPVASPDEVDEIFEVPFAFLMDVANHQSHSGVWAGRERRYYAMPYESHNIWGATAGMIVNLRERLFGEA